MPEPGQNTLSVDVAIIGSGITGLSTGWHLQNAGIQKIVTISDESVLPQSSLSPGIVWGGQRDNYTRVSHAHGDGFAQKLWQMGHNARDRLVDFVRARGLRWQPLRRLRLAAGPEEKVEMEKAVGQLAAAGFTAGFLGPAEQAALCPADAGITAIQDEGETAGLVDPAAILAALEPAPQRRVRDSVLTLETGSQGVRLELASGRRVQAELVVLATHTRTGRFLPALEEVFVPVADQWLEASVDPPPGKGGGLVFSVRHGYEWGALAPDGHLLLGGGRFMRPFAGIGFDQPGDLLKKEIDDYLYRRIAEVFGWQITHPPARRQAGLVSIPCDELPVVGPMFGEDRILLAAGYLGSGLSMGFMAGACLAELIRTGTCADLPDGLHPARLRSL